MYGKPQQANADVLFTFTVHGETIPSATSEGKKNLSKSSPSRYNVRLILKWPSERLRYFCPDRLRPLLGMHAQAAFRFGFQTAL